MPRRIPPPKRQPSLTRRRNYLVHAASLEELKMSSKNGDMQRAKMALQDAFSIFTHLSGLLPAFSYYSQLSRSDTRTKLIVKRKSHFQMICTAFHKMIHLIFTPDIEHRSALYYAAQCGHAPMVEWYMSLYVLERLTKRSHLKKLRSVKFCNEPRTLRSWLELLKFRNSTSFDMRDFDACHLTSTNQNVKATLCAKKYSISQIFEVSKNGCGSAEKWEPEFLVFFLACFLDGVMQGQNAIATAETKKNMVKPKRPKLQAESHDDIIFCAKRVSLYQSQTSEDDFSIEGSERANLGGIDNGTKETTRNTRNIERGSKKGSFCQESEAHREGNPTGLREFEFVGKLEKASEHFMVSLADTRDSCSDWEILSDTPSVLTIPSPYSSLAKRDVKSYKDAVLQVAPEEEHFA